jgi:hypothetical protein
MIDMLERFCNGTGAADVRIVGLIDEPKLGHFVVSNRFMETASGPLLSAFYPTLKTKSSQPVVRTTER